jgi:hypothetical protein
MNETAETASTEAWGSRLQLTMASNPLANVPRSLSEYVGVFHDWIRHGKLDELLIDVASYEHVPAGPGILLVGHESDYSVSLEETRIVLMCRHKRDPREEGDAFKRCLRRLLRAASLLEDEPTLSEPPSFPRNELHLVCNDRLQHRNEDATVQPLEPSIRRTLADVLAAECTSLERLGEPRERLMLRIQWNRPIE